MHTLRFFGEILDMFLAPEDILLMQQPFPAEVQLYSSKTKYNFFSVGNIKVFNMDEGCLLSSCFAVDTTLCITVINQFYSGPILLLMFVSLEFSL